jgi:hypothetical protein
MYAATLAHRRWLWPLKFALEGTAASEVGIPGLSHIPTGRSRMGVRSGDLEDQGLGPGPPIVTQFSFYSNRIAIRG